VHPAAAAAAGLDFEEHFLRIRPQLLVVTEDDKYGQAKRDLCAQVCKLAMDKWLWSLASLAHMWQSSQVA
jgi:hypothetical protein